MFLPYHENTNPSVSFSKYICEIGLTQYLTKHSADKQRGEQMRERRRASSRVRLRQPLSFFQGGRRLGTYRSQASLGWAEGASP